MNRLFRSRYFSGDEKQLDTMQFTFREKQILYGPNELHYNFMSQRSPLIQEILNIKPESKELLWIGEHKYRGWVFTKLIRFDNLRHRLNTFSIYRNDPRLIKLELEYVVPDAQLSLVKCSHGILGHPKKLYNTMLILDWNAVRREDFSAEYDPYQLLTKSPVLDTTFDKRWVIMPDFTNFNYNFKIFCKNMLSFSPFYRNCFR